MWVIVVGCTPVIPAGAGEVFEEPGAGATMPDAAPTQTPEPAEPEPSARTPEPRPIATVPERRVVISPSSTRTLVLWTDRAIVLTEDDGATFNAILQANDRVRSVAFDERGSLWALIGTRLAHRLADGRERWRDLSTHVDVRAWDDDDAFAIRLSASSVGVAIAVPHSEPEHLAHILFTQNAGAHWSTSFADSTMSSSSIATIRVDGMRVTKGNGVSLLVEWAQGRDCATTFATWHRGRIGAPRLSAVVEYPEADSRLHLGHDGWGYVARYEVDEGVGCVHAPLRRRRRRIDEISWRCGGPVFSDIMATQNATFARRGDALVSLAGGTARTLVSDLPKDAVLLAVDADLRPILRTEKGIVRSEADGTLTHLDAHAALDRAGTDPHP